MVGRGNPRFLEYLQEERAEHLKNLVMAHDEAQMRRAQGAVQCLDALFEALTHWQNPR